jgi:Putative zinc-finger
MTMRERENRRERIHGRIWELLPWYVNGTLSERERERIEAHLADCLRCQEEERACRQTAAAIQTAGEMSPSPHPVQLQRMLARIDESEESARSAREERGGWARFGAFVAMRESTPGRLRLALVAQAALILLLVGVLAWEQARPLPAAPAAPQFGTLSDPAPAPVTSVRLRVLFAPQASAEEIRDLLLGVHGEITAGPSPLGVYTIAVPAAQEPVEIVLARLRSEPKVVAFAGTPAGAEPR